MTPEFLEIVGEQIDIAQDNFIARECQIADGWPEEMFFDGSNVVAINFAIKGDDSKDYNIYMSINLAEEDHTLLSQSEFEDLSEEFDDISNEIPDL
jgi:hypothetical protein